MKGRSMGKHKKMATRPKPDGRIVQENIENAIAMTRQGRRRIKEFHQQARDISTCKEYLELLGIFESIEETLKASRFEEKA